MAVRLVHDDSGAGFPALESLSVSFHGQIRSGPFDAKGGGLGPTRLIRLLALLMSRYLGLLDPTSSRCLCLSLSCLEPALPALFSAVRVDFLTFRSCKDLCLPFCL